MNVQIGTAPVTGFTYAWLPTAGLSDPAIANPIADPASTTTYSLVVTETATGCVSTNTAEVLVTVDEDLPTVTITASSQTVCAGESVTLTGGGADTYIWDNGVVDGTPFVPTVTTTYTVTGTENNGCINTAVITVTVIENLIEKECNVIDANYCLPGEQPFYNFFWDEMQIDNTSPFSSDATHKLNFTAYNDGTAMIIGSTRLGNCIMEVYVVLKDKKDWVTWSTDGGSFKEEGCSGAVKEDLSYYVIDGEKSYAVAVGGDCLDTGTFKITQRPDPYDQSTGNYGVLVGLGGALNDSNVGADGLAGWAWMGPEGDERKWHIDFNFLLDCEFKPGCDTPKVLACEIGPDVKNETCYDANDGMATVIPTGGVAPYLYQWSNGETSMTAISLGSGQNSATVTDANGTISTCNVTISEPDISIEVSLKVFLGGTYNPNTGLMFDYLRANELISVHSPYLDDLQLNPLVLDITGNNAIVDWVWVEIRDSNRIDIIDEVSALVQADGDIVGVDGVSPLKFGIPQGDYHIMISHRNHLGVITANELSFTYCLNIDLDLTVDIDLVFGRFNGASSTVDGRVALYSGDCDGNGQIQNTDKIEIHALLGTSGLLDADLNMNGQVQNSDIQNQLNPNLGKGFQNSQSNSGKSSRSTKSESVDLKLYAKRKKI